MFLFSAAKKVAEVAGIIDEPAIVHFEEIQEQPIAKPNDLSQVVTAKQVGNVPAFVKVVDPAVDLAILEELFGVYRDAEKVMEMSCPDCGVEYTVPYIASLNLEEYCQCPDCDEEGVFSDFLDNIEVKTSTSRTPSGREILFATGANVHRHWSEHDTDRVAEDRRENLMSYYGVLTGNLDTMSDRDKARGRRDDGINPHTGRWATSCSGCQDEGDDCQCGNNIMQYYGRLTSISDMDGNAFGEDD